MYIKACPHNLGLQVKDNAAEKKFFGIPLLPLLPLFWLCGKFKSGKSGKSGTLKNFF